MPVTIHLGPNHSLRALTPHGLEVALPPGQEAQALLRMLLQEAEVAQAAKKPPSPDFHYILAEWERIGPTGAGKVPKRAPKADVQITDANAARVYDKKGRVTRSAWNDPLPILV